MNIQRLKQAVIPKMAVLATGLAAAILVSAVHPQPAQAFPSKAQDCTNCHGVGVSAAVTATPSTATPAAGAAYAVAITMPAGVGDTGYWIANSDAAGITGTSTGTPTSWAWNFGNGTTSNLQNPSVTYTAAGAYEVTLIATNAGGAGTPATQTITVTAAPAPSTAKIYNLSEVAGESGDTISITGTGFGQAGVVKFGSVTAEQARRWVRNLSVA